MADRRIYAGYYRRYDGKIIYVVTMAKDATAPQIVRGNKQRNRAASDRQYRLSEKPGAYS